MEELTRDDHAPVLIDQSLHFLALGAGKTIVDCTLGLAGHGRLIADRVGPEGLLIGIDADPRNLQTARDRLLSSPGRSRLFHANFAELPTVIDAVGIQRVDGIFADLGVSTNQLFDARYGLSFSGPMPLDMRLDPRIDRTAAHWVNFLPETDLANVLYELAQERYSRRIARKIVEARRISPITTTERLAELVREAYPTHKPSRPTPIDPATRTFLALRMLVNSEVANLQALLDAAPRCLRSGGRLVVISFQSSEDRLVKHALAHAAQRGILSVLTTKPLTPDQAEIMGNPRSRSAKLRAAEKTDAEVL